MIIKQAEKNILPQNIRVDFIKCHWVVIKDIRKRQKNFLAHIMTFMYRPGVLSLDYFSTFLQG